VFLNKDSIDVAELSTKIGEIFQKRKSADKLLFLAAEEKLNYEGIVRILDLARKGDESLKIGIVSDDASRDRRRRRQAQRPLY
jgi:biopolymer transport protein ExbD